MGRPREPLEERFWKYVRKTRGCWLWTGATVKGGYGQLHEDGRLLTAHRISWTLHKGPIPPGKSVLHTCDAPGCVRPKHLYLGTHKQNMADRGRRGRACHGRAVHTAKLTEAQVRKIRADYRPFVRGRGYTYYAEKYGITRRAVACIIHQLTWRHL